jgi:hypothetical protein
MRKLVVAVVAVICISIPVAATASSSQVIDASLSSTVSMTTSPTATISSWTLASTGANTRSGGQMTINANGPYLVSVTADKTRMTEYVTSTSSYVSSSPKTLTSPLTVTATRSSGTAVTPGAGLAAIVGTSTTLATGTGLGTDTYDVSLSQPTAITDTALPSGETYHIELTYTASSTL